MTIFGETFLVRNMTNQILGKVTEAFYLRVERLRMATKSFIGGIKYMDRVNGFQRHFRVCVVTH